MCSVGPGAWPQSEYSQPVGLKRVETRWYRSLSAFLKFLARSARGYFSRLEELASLVLVTARDGNQ